MKLFISPSSKTMTSGGVRTFIDDFTKLVRQHGHQVTENEDLADLIITNANSTAKHESDIVWTHGIYPIGNGGWDNRFKSVNQSIFNVIAGSLRVVAVSNWGGKLIEKYTGEVPAIIHNGIFWNEVSHSSKQDGFILWPKTSTNAVCKSNIFEYLASNHKGNFASFVPLQNSKKLNPGSGKVACEILNNTSILISTNLENSSFMVMEAMAHGIPVLGFNEGMLSEQLTHQIGCYLARPGDIPELEYGLSWLQSNWLSQREEALNWSQSFEWSYQWEKIEEVLSETLEEKKRTPSVSIIIPCYNYSKWVGKAIESALDQTIPCEVIAIDDCSTDNSLSEMHSYEKENKNLTVLKMEKNSGVPAVRNAGIRLAKGTHIICLDADDWIEPSYAEKMLKAFTKRNIGAAFSPLKLWWKNALNGVIWFNNSASKSEQLIGHNTVPCHAMFSKKWWSRVDGFDESIPGTEDANFWLKLFIRGAQIVKASTEPLVNYRTHPQSLSSTNRPAWNFLSQQEVWNPLYSIVLPHWNSHIIWLTLTNHPEATIHVLDNPDGKYSSPIMNEFIILDDSKNFDQEKAQTWDQIQQF